MTIPTRRGFMETAAAAISGAVATGAAPPSQANEAAFDADALAAEISANLFADDGLARPIPETPAVSDLAKGRSHPGSWWRRGILHRLVLRFHPWPL
jgi:hypothetical protein